MAALFALLAAPSLVSASLFSPKIPFTQPNITSCLTQTPTFSCENTTAIVNTCCSPTPGGLVLATQFWDTYTGREREGQLLPKGAWGLHGLWPDNCDGSFAQYCDLTRQFDPAPSPNTTTGKPDGTPVPPYKGPGVDTFIEKFGRYDLLEFMNAYWINQGGSNVDFWGHEVSYKRLCGVLWLTSGSSRSTRRARRPSMSPATAPTTRSTKT